MDVIIQSLGFTAGEGLEGFIKEKLQVLKSDKIIRANVTLYKGPESAAESDYCEIRLEVPGNDPFVKKHSPYFETSVTDCIDVLQKMINKNKDKQIDRRQGEATEIQDALMEDDDVDLEDVVR